LADIQQWVSFLQVANEKELAVQRLEHDRRYLANREKEERQPNAQLVIQHDAPPNSSLKWLPFVLPPPSSRNLMQIYIH